MTTHQRRYQIRDSLHEKLPDWDIRVTEEQIAQTPFHGADGFEIVAAHKRLNLRCGHLVYREDFEKLSTETLVKYILGFTNQKLVEHQQLQRDNDPHD